ncbi:MAG: hypothetical protein COA59_02360 [Colwellia sp.]|jgi:hypothetical protein|nr:MAG: hypothetical protein COA59_02360 [Colwellia sp.]
MVKPPQHQTHYTRQVQILLSKIYGRSKQQDSMLERAIHYFNHQSFMATDQALSESHLELEKLERIDRHNHLLNICREIIDLTEGDSFEESNRKSAQLLGTIQLISPTEGKKVPANNEYCKSLYKAILSLRLLDRLLLDIEITDLYIANVLAEFPEQPFAEFDCDAQRRVIAQIKIPLLMAALLQDIGLYQSEAQELLVGADSTKNPYRTLDRDERKKLLTINYKQTLKYITDGLSVPVYIGSSKEERDQFVIDEQGKLQFLQQLIKSSFKPKQTVGNLLKVPQIYTSIIFSTKDSYNYKVLPKVYQVLNKNAELGACSQKIVDALYQITGMFPQGYGVIYMPQEEGCYEYAIVNRLYPTLPEEPLCRIATRKLAFIGYGHNIEVKKISNLYFPHMAKKIANLSKERLNEILELLSSNYKERQELDLLPRCWYANEFFSVKTNQKLWNKVD